MKKIIKKLIFDAREKEEVRKKLEVLAKKLAVTAKEKEETRRKLEVVAKELAVTAKEKEETRRKLEVVAKELAVTAKEKEETRRKLEVVAKELAVTAKEKEETRRKLEVVAKKHGEFEQHLKESEVSYRRLFETAHDGVLILNSKTGQITDVNPYLVNLLGYSKKEFLNKKMWDVGAFKNMKASREAFKSIQKEGYIRYDNLPLETKNGELINVEFVSNSYISNGVLVIQCNIRDITERKRLDLIKETKRLLEEEKIKVRSIADATHELRTPLAVIKGNVDLALHNKGKNKKSASNALRAIDYEIKHLSHILTDLSLLTSDAWELKGRIVYEKINVRDLINTTVKRCKALSYKKKISITTTKIPDVTVMGDRVYLEKMLVNLIKNSILYGKDGGHTKIDIEQHVNLIIINISDNGIGISEEDLPHIFERFYRVDKFHRSGGNSIGLGLAIVKWIAEIHSGSVSATSLKGKGSVFSVNLPIKVIE